MSDFDMCKDNECPKRMKCLRFRAKADEYQWYFTESPRKGRKCDYYYPGGKLTTQDIVLAEFLQLLKKDSPGNQEG